MTHPRKPGWYCTLDGDHFGPCPLRPTLLTRLVHALTGRWR